DLEESDLERLGIAQLSLEHRPHELAQARSHVTRTARAKPAAELAEALDERLGAFGEHRAIEPELAPEMMVQRRRLDTGALEDLARGHRVVPELGEQRRRGVEQARASWLLAGPSRTRLLQAAIGAPRP